jgi:hypothetical protein
MKRRRVKMQTPVALIIFNRPDLTERVFNQIAKAKPTQLFVIADGPRPGRPGETEKCQASRAVIDKIDWNCELLKNYSDINLGCGHRPASGISWVFERTDRAIILEDDVVPNLTFFRFCDELLERYVEDERVMQICGHNYQLGQKRGPYSYYFSRRSICAGGWATWRRAWKYFDFHIKLWPTLRETSFLLDILEDESLVRHWTKMLDTAHDGTPTSTAAHATDYWDFQWNFAIWSQSGLSIFPNAILVSNIGYREDGTHTRSANRWANLSSVEMEFPLQHPLCVVRNREADHFSLELERQTGQSSRHRSGRVANKIAQAMGEIREKISYLRKASSI